VRKWTKSACVVLAWGILPILVAVGGQSPARPAQATHHFASSTAQVTLTSFTEVATPASTMKYLVQPGDTLSGIATALAVRGSWQALYAANRRQQAGHRPQPQQHPRRHRPRRAWPSCRSPLLGRAG
jgi:hypothetical protein